MTVSVSPAGGSRYGSQSQISHNIDPGLLLVACSDARPPGDSARGMGPLAQRMLSDRAADWLTIEVPGAYIHVRRGSAAEADGRAISGSVGSVRHELLALLGGPQSNDTALRAHLFLVNSRDDTQRLAGHPLVGFIQQGSPREYSSTRWATTWLLSYATS